MEPYDKYPRTKDVPYIYNIDIVAANTQYALAIPVNTKFIQVQCRDSTELRVAFETGKVAGTTDIFTVKTDTSAQFADLKMAAGSLYIGCGTTAKVAEVMLWT